MSADNLMLGRALGSRVFFSVKGARVSSCGTFFLQRYFYSAIIMICEENILLKAKNVLRCLPFDKVIISEYSVFDFLLAKYSEKAVERN